MKNDFCLLFETFYHSNTFIIYSDCIDENFTVMAELITHELTNHL